MRCAIDSFISYRVNRTFICIKINSACLKIGIMLRHPFVAKLFQNLDGKISVYLMVAVPISNMIL